MADRHGAGRVWYTRAEPALADVAMEDFRQSSTQPGRAGDSRPAALRLVRDEPSGLVDPGGDCHFVRSGLGGTVVWTDAGAAHRSIAGRGRHLQQPVQQQLHRFTDADPSGPSDTAFSGRRRACAGTPTGHTRTHARIGNSRTGGTQEESDSDRSLHRLDAIAGGSIGSRAVADPPPRTDCRGTY